MHIAELVAALGQKVKEHVAAAIAPLAARLGDVEKAAGGIPELVRHEVAKLPAAKPGEPGKDGKSVTPEEIRQLVDETAAKLPRPKDGDPGRDGKSVDVEQVKAMLAELVDQAVKQIPAPKNGEDGKSVDVEQVKAMLAELVDQAVKQIPAPKNGKDGEPGLDALAIQPLDGIDETKSYRRGTWAAHRGGLIRAARATDPIGEKTLEECGWSVVVEGLAALLVTQAEKNPRQIIVSSSLTSGKTVAVDVLIPALIYRGVWKDGDAYDTGDAVTWAGAMWHRDQVDGKGAPGSPGSGWTLCVKKGRDGK